MSFPKFVYMTKNTQFFPILHVFAPLNDVRAYSAWSWKATLITWIFGRAWYLLDIRVAPGVQLIFHSYPIRIYLAISKHATPDDYAINLRYL